MRRSPDSLRHMTTTLYLDCVGGVAGDMLLAALVSAGAPLEAVRAALPVDNVDLEITGVERHGLAASTLKVTTVHEHAHRRWRDIRAIIDTGSMPRRAKDRAHRAFGLLAHAEAAVHQISPEEVMFHEVGALDAIVDICGVAIALDELGVDEVICSPLPLGTGTIRSAHGVLPLPAPATLEILRGHPVYGVDIRGETVTPTGAALVASLSERFGPIPPMTVSTVGTGAGNADWPVVPNVVRAVLGQAKSAVAESHPVSLVLETNLDDMLPEWVPDVLRSCLDAGAHDAWTTPAAMKQGRPGITLSALVSASSERAVAQAILRHTTALGVRVRIVEHRWALDRKFGTVTVDGHEISVKLGLLEGEIVNAKPEHRDCVRAAEKTGRSIKSVWVEALAAAQSSLIDPARNPTSTDN
jgi:pyridinium-3,5-bisthiocarboxylic acid mononucleotide nickel chelatase